MGTSSVVGTPIIGLIVENLKKKKQVLWHYRFEVGQRPVTQNQQVLNPKWGKSTYNCRRKVKGNTLRTVLENHTLSGDSNVFFDARVLLGTPDINQTEIPLRLVGYTVADKPYWIATDRFDLSAEQVAAAYKLRWEIEKFFAWWKRHLKVYHLFARSRNGLMVQILSGLITYLLLAIYCQESMGNRSPFVVFGN